MNNTYTEVKAIEVSVTREDRTNGVTKKWDVTGQRGRYIINLTDRGFNGYVLNSSDVAGETPMQYAQVMKIVRTLKLG